MEVTGPIELDADTPIPPPPERTDIHRMLEDNFPALARRYGFV